MTDAEAAAALAAAIEVELRRPVSEPVHALAAQLAAQAGGAAAAVLFYGSALRDGDLDGVLDVYVLVDHQRAWPGPRLGALAHRVLPPQVGWLETVAAGRALRVKYAVMTLAGFRRAMSVDRLDTTLWARFSQPCACVWQRGADDFAAVRDGVSAAVTTAARWAAWLGPARGDAAAYWRALYARTYDAELRVERRGRGGDIVSADPDRYARLLPAAWRAAAVPFAETADGEVVPAVAAAERDAAERRWRRRRRLGRPLNLLRLLKAASTFANAVDYVAWKVERHSGYRLEPSAFQRRHPLLAAPALYWRLRSRGVLR